MADKEVKAVDTAAAKDKPAKEKAKKPNAFVRGWKRVTRYFREMKSELKKVVWPTRQQVVRNTVVDGVLSAERTILVQLQTIGGILLVLHGIIVSLLALRASEGDLHPCAGFRHILAPP